MTKPDIADMINIESISISDFVKGKDDDDDDSNDGVRVSVGGSGGNGCAEPGISTSKERVRR